MRAFTKDTWRTVKASKKRFASLVAICALGACMLTGLSMACIDLRAAADALYARQDLFDISVQSTLGLTDEDIAELSEVDGVERAEGGYQVDTYTHVDGVRATVTLKTLLDSGLNEPFVVEGELPDRAGEVAVTESYLNATGKRVGDTLSFDDGIAEDPTGLKDLESGDDGSEPAGDAQEAPLIPGGTYTITAAVIDPSNITQPDGPVAFRASTSSDYTFFVSRDAVADTGSYTVAYLKVSGLEGLSAYSEEYEGRVAEVRRRVEDIAPQRERARTDQVKSDASEDIDASEAEARRQISDAALELDEAQAELDGSLAEALSGQRELDEQRSSALSQLSSAQQAIDANRVSALSGIAEARAGLDQIASTRAELASALEGLDELESAKAGADQGVSTAQGYVDQARSGGDALVAQLSGSGIGDATGVSAAWDSLSAWSGTSEPATEEAAFVSALGDYEREVADLDRQAREQLDALGQRLRPQLERRDQIDARTDEIDRRTAEIDERLQEIGDRLSEIDQALGTSAGDGGLEAERDELESERGTLSAEREALEQERSGLAEERGSLADALAPYDSLSAQTERLSAYAAMLEALTSGNPSDASELASGMGRAAAGLARARAAQQAVDGAIAGIDGGIGGSRERIQAALQQLDGAERTAREGIARAQAGLDALDAGQSELDGERASALARLEEAQAQIDDGLARIREGQAEIDEGRSALEEESSLAMSRISEARRKVEDVKDATWYVQDRTALGSFSSIDSDASSIEAIARIIPVIFYVVAILVSLTTATRMVDEERPLIGLYKALGYSKGRILSKYLLYTASAALIGGILGDVAGFVGLPYVLLYIFQAMYLLPLFSLHFDLGFAALGIGAFVIGIAGSTLVTCRADLRETPASLMRPRAPRAGSRILLERIPPLWRRLGFLNKVTARNLFRYKKRLAMTVFGIMGCTALLICGFAIKNTVESLAPRQYGDIYRYDLMAATSTDDYDSALAELEGSGQVTDLVPIGVDNITVEHGGDKESMQLYVMPTGSSIDSYVSLQTLDGDPIDLDDAGVVITNNAATVLGLEAGDEADITTTSLDEARATVAAVTRNYLGNAVYMSEDAYEKLFGPLEANGFFCHLAGTSEEQVELSDELESDDLFLSVTSVAKMHEQFEQSFTLINVVVYVVIGLAAGLAFVVLFTLSTVNIGEREREIATIKVLGFRPREVRTYINKETFVLTLIGILLGLPAGWALSESFTYILKMPSIFFDVVVDPWCYALAAAFSAVFALAVSLITNRMLDRIDMVEALKSPE